MEPAGWHRCPHRINTVASFRTWRGFRPCVTVGRRAHEQIVSQKVCVCNTLYKSVQVIWLSVPVPTANTQKTPEARSH